MERERWRERMIGAGWLATIGLWLLVAAMAITLIGDPIPAHFNLALVMAGTVSLATVSMTLAYADQRARERRMDRLDAAVRALAGLTARRDEAWHAINALLGNGSEPDNVRRLPRINTGPN